jgi:4-hydroxy-tetrahydrodipicolinate synthase
MHPLSGVFAAAVTPLDADFSPDPEALSTLLNFLAGRGCHGLLLLGTTGEGPSFSARERIEIYRNAARIRENHPGIRLLAGTGTPSLDETIQLTRAAFEQGFDGVVVLPPYYYRNASEDGLFLYFETLIRKAVPADGTLLGYHFPTVAGIGFSIDLLQRLRAAFPRQFAGIKDSSHDAGYSHALTERFGRDLLVLTGTDSLFLDALQHQAAGCITAPANLISPQLRAIWDAFQAGQDAGPLQEAVTHARHVLEQAAPFPSILKALLHQLHGFPLWPVRPPLLPSPSGQVELALKGLAEWKH